MISLYIVEILKLSYRIQLNIYIRYCQYCQKFIAISIEFKFHQKVYRRSDQLFPRYKWPEQNLLSICLQ